MVARVLDLHYLLNGGLPLNLVGPHLRHAARRALRSNDPKRMLIVAKVIVSELLRRGDLLRVAVEGDAKSNLQLCLLKGTTQLLDLSSLGSENLPILLGRQSGETKASLPDNTRPENPPGSGLQNIDTMLRVMEDAQKFNISDPQSGETGIILESIVRLLGKFTPQFQVHIMLFEETLLGENQNLVFLAEKEGSPVNWFKAREPGHSVWIPQAKELPDAITAEQDSENFSSAVAVPLFDHLPQGKTLTSRPEAGLLFLLGSETWARDTMLKLATRLSRFVTHRWQQHSEVNKRIHIDALTGLFNKGFFEGQFELQVERAKRTETPLTLVMVDFDEFKEINDVYDHIIGDEILKMVARRLREELRRIDIICRVGGDEFALILPDTDFAAAQEVLQRLLNAPFIERVTYEGQEIDLKVTFSYGAVTLPQSGSDAFELYRKADTLLFLSKDRGRNQCHFWNNDGNHLQLLPGSTSI